MDLDPFLGFQVDPDRNGKGQGPSRGSVLAKMMLLMTDVGSYVITKLTYKMHFICSKSEL